MIRRSECPELDSASQRRARHCQFHPSPFPDPFQCHRSPSNSFPDPSSLFPVHSPTFTLSHSAECPSHLSQCHSSPSQFIPRPSQFQPAPPSQLPVYSQSIPSSRQDFHRLSQYPPSSPTSLGATQLPPSAFPVPLHPTKALPSPSAPQLIPVCPHSLPLTVPPVCPSCWCPRVPSLAPAACSAPSWISTLPTSRRGGSRASRSSQTTWWPPTWSPTGAGLPAPGAAGNPHPQGRLTYTSQVEHVSLEHPLSCTGIRGSPRGHWESHWAVLGATGKELKGAVLELEEGLGAWQWLGRGLGDAGEGEMGLGGSWWALGGSLGVLGVTGREFGSTAILSPPCVLLHTPSFHIPRSLPGMVIAV
ncbi:uncharacterized protein LOC132340553 [Haemorhous mexicanus]|uniref:uncharacterized protein LOC132340553 n=1 Tax=Haemorhous mexicanus TaxID=30427 RepID=UPI0028BDE0F4|nr:uncharacterized protein LOC132340553 [Haemorhous mexicanus]